MQRSYSPLVLVMLGAGLAAGWCSLWHVPARTVSAAPASDDPVSLPKCEFQGVGSCAATACHNNNGARGSRGSEYSTWINYDPHARAYSDLFNDRSHLIQTNRARKSAAADELCLRCHATGGDQTPLPPVSELADGVGCESCHGPAERWRTEHYRRDWQERRDKAARGFRETKDLRVRAEACVECHVGSADREVNHDLIAAGHPRLRFEYAAYLANYPKHWSAAADRQRHPDFEARAWMIGQVASARAAVRVLERRTSVPGKPWPEFAEYGCFACHHDLTDRNWRQRGPGAARPGALPWGSWYTVLLPGLSEAGPVPAPVSLKPLDQLDRLMSDPFPDRQQVAREARRIDQLLGGWLGELDRPKTSHAELLRLLTGLARDDRKVGTANWDSAAQLYLGLVAVHRGLSDSTPDYHGEALVKETLRDLDKELNAAFPSKREVIYDSPANFDPKRLGPFLDRLQRQLQPERRE